KTEDKEKREQLLDRHASQLNQHVKELASKAYWDALEGSPEFVYLYLPIESLYSEALSRKPNLHEEFMRKKVAVVTPTTLMASLTIIAHEWHQAELIQNSKEIADLGKEMYERLLTLIEHFYKIGTNLTQSVKTYNAAKSSFEERAIPQTKKFNDLGIRGKKEMVELAQIDILPHEPKDKYLKELKEHTKNEDLSSKSGN
ncbi:MAG: DNA recombination protein RmuC, partial [Acidobacteriota bacterium]|nr:DNA recombination protein RmuC [Acidobacteriota bacterium]